MPRLLRWTDRDTILPFFSDSTLSNDSLKWIEYASWDVCELKPDLRCRFCCRRQKSYTVKEFTGREVLCWSPLYSESSKMISMNSTLNMFQWFARVPNLDDHSVALPRVGGQIVLCKVDCSIRGANIGASLNMSSTCYGNLDRALNCPLVSVSYF